MRISVRFFTILREITGKREETLEFPKGSKVTVQTVLDHLNTTYKKAFDEYVYDQGTGKVKGFLQFLVNGRSVDSPDEADTKLCDGDVLAILPPVSGG